MPEIGHVEKKPSVEHPTVSLEKKLGIESNYDRQIEGALFIDKTFLNYALITEVAKRPEHAFGEKAWADYLQGRLFAKEYGNNDLTPEFIINLHTQLTQTVEPEVAGKIRDVGVIGASYDDGQPVTYTPKQVETIEKNSFLSFKRSAPDTTTGYIVYPHMGPNTQEAVLKDIDEICEWFNNEKKKVVYNPHVLAGMLQRKLISLHPFRDGNGRLSRVLMNWSLENDGQAPSVIDNPGDDILTDEETWILQLVRGSKQYADLQTRKKALDEVGIDNVTALFNLGTDKAFYDYIFKHLKEAPPLPTNGDKHKHQTYEQFLKDFKEEMKRFQEFMGTTADMKINGKDQEITHGGLITPEFMQFIEKPRATLPAALQTQFYSDTEAYRGGIVEGHMGDEEVCRMFVATSGVATAYRPLQRLHYPAVTQKEVPQPIIKESMDFYNRMIASDYIQKLHPHLPNPYLKEAPPIQDFNVTVKDHVVGGERIWRSPFASMSLNYKESKGWAQKFYSGYAKDARHGVLIKAKLPKEGTVLTFGKNFAGLTTKGLAFEYEALVVGAVHPQSVTGIEVYDKSGSRQTPSLSATRVEDSTGVQVKIEDRRGATIIERTYSYDSTQNRFTLIAQQTTSRPSDEKVKVPDFAMEGIHDYKGLISDIAGTYQSPFADLYKKTPIPEKYFSKNNFTDISINNKSIIDKYILILDKIPKDEILHFPTETITSEIHSKNYDKYSISKIDKSKFEK